MIEINNPITEPTFFLAFSNDESICHSGKLMNNNCMSTGQPNIEEFTDINTYIDRSSEFGIIIDSETGLEIIE